MNFLKLFTLSIFLFLNAQILSMYQSASVTPYTYDKDGNLKFLLGKEKRKQGTYWFSFGGKKDKNENNPIDTAKREGKEETAGQIAFKHDALIPGVPFYLSLKKPYFAKSTKPDQIKHVLFFLESKYVDPKEITESSEKLKEAKGKAAHVEKTDWVWIDAQDLLNWAKDSKAGDYNFPKLNAPLYPIYVDTLKSKEVQDYINLLIEAGKANKKCKENLKRLMLLNVNI